MGERRRIVSVGIITDHSILNEHGQDVIFNNDNELRKTCEISTSSDNTGATWIFGSLLFSKSIVDGRYEFCLPAKCYKPDHIPPIIRMRLPYGFA